MSLTHNFTTDRRHGWSLCFVCCQEDSGSIRLALNLDSTRAPIRPTNRLMAFHCRKSSMHGLPISKCVSCPCWYRTFIFISVSSLSMPNCIVLLPPCFLFQLPRDTVRRLLQHQCQTAGGCRGPDQWELRWLWHLLLQDSFPQWLYWPLAYFGNHTEHLTGPASSFYKRWKETASNCHLKAKFVAVFGSEICSLITLFDKPGNVCRRTITDLFHLCLY